MSNLYIGIGDKAHQVVSYSGSQGIMLGIDNKARRIYAGYIGINGIAKQFYQYITPPPPITTLSMSGTISEVEANVDTRYYDKYLIRPSSYYVSCQWANLTVNGNGGSDVDRSTFYLSGGLYQSAAMSGTGRYRYKPQITLASYGFYKDRFSPGQTFSMGVNSRSGTITSESGWSPCYMLYHSNHTFSARATVAITWQP